MAASDSRGLVIRCRHRRSLCRLGRGNRSRKSGRHDSSVSSHGRFMAIGTVTIPALIVSLDSFLSACGDLCALLTRHSNGCGIRNMLFALSRRWRGRPPGQIETTCSRYLSSFEPNGSDSRRVKERSSNRSFKVYRPCPLFLDLAHRLPVPKC